MTMSWLSAAILPSSPFCSTNSWTISFDLFRFLNKFRRAINRQCLDGSIRPSGAIVDQQTHIWIGRDVQLLDAAFEGQHEQLGATFVADVLHQGAVGQMIAAGGEHTKVIFRNHFFLNRRHGKITIHFLMMVSL